VVVRLRVADPGAVDRRLLAELVAANCPAQVPHRIEVLAEMTTDQTGDGERR
jgi:hypothetical protein